MNVRLLRKFRNEFNDRIKIEIRHDSVILNIVSFYWGALTNYSSIDGLIENLRQHNRQYILERVSEYKKKYPIKFWKIKILKIKRR